MKLGNVSIKALVSAKTGNIGLFLAGVYFCLVSILLTGAIDYPNMILGLTFVAVAVISARPSPLVVSGVLTAFLGLVNLLSIANVLPIDTAWIFAAVFAVGILILEFANIKIGKSSKKAQIAVIIPMVSLFFMFVLAIVGLNPVLRVDLATEPLKFINYVALMFLTGMITLEKLGWKLMKKNQGWWITLLGLVCVATAFMGTYASLYWY